MSSDQPAQRTGGRTPRTAVWISVSCLVISGGLFIASRWHPTPNQTKTDHQSPPAAESPSTTTSSTRGAALGSSEAATRFRWNSLENRDLKRYVENLKGVECPFSTLCDIIIGEVNRLYQPRLAVLRYGGERGYWKTGGVSRPSEAEVALRKQQSEELARLESERDQLVRDLLGIDYKSFTSRYSDRSFLWDETLGFMPDSIRKDQAHTVLRRYQDLERQVIDAAGGTLGVAEMKERAELFQRKFEELKGILTPTEMEELKLRDSLTAETMRNHSLVGFNPSEDEFRKLFKIYSAHEDQLGTLPGSLQSGDATTSAVASRESEIAAALGPERFAEYKRSQDMTFRNLTSITDFHGLPQSSAIDVYNIREEVLAARGQLLNSGEVSDSQRTAALRQLEGEAQRKVSSILGEKAYQSYSDSFGAWMRELTKN